MKKRYLIMLIIAIILVIALGTGFAFAYFFTDIFRSNKQLFSKYISQNKEIVEILEDEDVKAYSEKQKNTPYTSEGTIKTNVTFPDSSEAQVATALQNCNITFSGKVDNSSKYMYENIKANYSDTQSMQFDLYRNGDVYAGKINEVLFKYVGIENNNLKEFATKMQLPENIISAIPNKIDLNSLAGVSNIFTDEEKSSLKEKYLKIITDSLTDDMFSKEKSSEDTVYTLSLTKTQLNNIIFKILAALKEDELIIAKLKNYAINNFNMTEENAETYVTQYKETLQKSIDSNYTFIDSIDNIKNGISIRPQTSLQNESTDVETEIAGSEEEIILTIKVYSNKSKLLKTELITRDFGDFVIFKSDDNIKFESINNGVTVTSAFIQKIKSPNETKFEFAFSKQNTQIFDLMVGFSGLDTNSAHESSELTFDYDLGNSSITEAKTKFVATYNVTKTFGDVQKQEVQNSEILLINTAPSMQNLETLYNNVSTKTALLNSTKLQALGLTEEQNPFMYYVPSIVPVGATYIMQNPDKGSYFAIPAFLGGISISMLTGDNDILSRASENRASTDILSTKEQILLDLNGAITEYYSKKYTTNSTSTESLYTTAENVLKNFNPNNKNIEYSYNNGNITIKSKKDPTKIITGTLSKDGNINWN